MIKVKKLFPDAKLPTISYDEPLGVDVYLHRYEMIHIPPQYPDGSYSAPTLHGMLIKAYTGVAIELPKDWGAFIKDRSGVATKWHWFTRAGVIENTYRGEWVVIMESQFHERFPFEKGDKIAQFVLIPRYKDMRIIEVDELSPSIREDKGFGSSGIKNE